MTEKQVNPVAKIRVFGIGGAGCNAVNLMVKENVQGVEFFVANTDLQVLNLSACKNKLILGKQTTKGLGAGANPDIGYKAAMESEDEIRQAIEGADMVFLTAGLGGGTGTGAAPVFAKIAKEYGVLTIGIVTRPFTFEGRKRSIQANTGLEELKKYVDSLIIVSNNQLLEVIGRIPLIEAFKEADNVLRQGVQTITDLMGVAALINLDFNDIKSVMEGQGPALIGIGMASGDNKAQEAAQKAITSPLLEAQIKGARNAIVNVTGGNSFTMQEANEAVDFITEAAGEELDIIFGVAINEQLEDEMIVTVIATGFDLPEPKNPTSIQDVRNLAQDIQKDSDVSVEDDSDIPGFIRFRN